jgi:hypothetical protein
MESIAHLLPFTGVVPAGHQHVRRLKQHLLLFDRLAIPALSIYLPREEEHMRADLTWLEGKGAVFEPDLTVLATVLFHRLAGDTAEDSLKRMDLKSDWLKVLNAQPWFPRMVGATIGGIPVIDWVRSSPRDQGMFKWGSVIEIVLENLPVPSDETAWEQILEFRADERVRGFHRDLRNWIRRAARSEASVHELAGEIESAARRYQTYMREYRIAKTMGTIQTAIKAGAAGAVLGIGADEVAALIGAVGGIAVSLRQRKAELLQEELTAPGSELAYIVKARERFGK